MFSFWQTTYVEEFYHKNAAPMKGRCQCYVGLSGLCCHVIFLLIFLEHYTSHGVKFIALTCTQKIQKWHRKGVRKQTELCHVPLSSLRNVRSSRKTLDSSHTKRKVNVSNDQALTDEIMGEKRSQKSYESQYQLYYRSPIQ